MTAQCSVFIATSLDGFISRTDGSIDWLMRLHNLMPPGEDAGYDNFITTIDALVMGRNSFEQALAFDKWPYGERPVVVMSRTLSALPAGTPSTVSLTSETPEALVARLSAHGCRRLYIDGGLTIQSFLNAGLIDDLTITTIPVLIGTGKPLFGALHADVMLEHVSTRAYDFGFVQNHYRIARSAPAEG